MNHTYTIDIENVENLTRTLKYNLLAADDTPIGVEYKIKDVYGNDVYLKDADTKVSDKEKVFGFYVEAYGTVEYGDGRRVSKVFNLEIPNSNRIKRSWNRWV